MPAICAATLTVLDLLEGGDELRKQLRGNAEHFRSEMTKLGFKLAGANHPIIPVMLGDAKLASTFAEQMLAEGVYVVGFSYPVVPQGQARIRTQMSAAHTREQLDRAIAAFAKVGRALGVIAVRALVKAKAEPGIWMQDVPVPEIGPNDVLIKVRKASICGTDIHIWNWDAWSQKTIKVPMVIGHEFMGEIAKLGAEVTGFQVGRPGQRRGAHHLWPLPQLPRRASGTSAATRSGSASTGRAASPSTSSLPAFNVFRVPKEIPDEIASFFDPLGNAVHTALSFDLVGEDVLITGAGPIGVMAAAISRHVGARHVVVTDVNPYRLELARKMGATRAVDVRSQTLRDVMAGLGMTEGFDVGMEMSGNGQAFRDLLE